MDEPSVDFALSCPAPAQEQDRVLLGHGGGGRLMRRLLEEHILPAFRSPLLEGGHDAAVFQAGSARLAFTTDTYVVRPLFFPGGDIGRLAVHGTVNDLAMAGARPLYLSCGLVLEEGLPAETLARVLCSIGDAAAGCGVTIATGDTKVVERGHADGLFVNTSGIGVVEHDLEIGPGSVRPGDVVLVSGDLGRHGIAVMQARDELLFESEIESDTAPLAGMVLELIAAGVRARCLRDLTRGGLASALVEIAETAGLCVEVAEAAIPVLPEVQAACEILGLDSVHVASEGRFVAFVPPADAEEALRRMQAHPQGGSAAVIGTVQAGTSGQVTVRSRLGVPRILDMLSGDQLPRIC